MENKTVLLKSRGFQILVVLLVLLLSGCPWNKNGNNSSGEDEGAALAGVSASATGLSIISQAHDANSPLTIEVEPSEDSVVLHVDKTGYETGLVYLPNTLTPLSSTVMLKKRLPPIQVDGATATTKTYELGYDLPKGTYVIIFQNQYGETEVPVFMGNLGEECLPFSDDPCAA